MRQVSDITGFLEHPVEGASITFAILFFASGVLHIWQTCKYKSWLYTWLLPFACLIFTASFICREYAAHDATSDSTYTPSQGLFYSAVPIITYPLYFFLPRLLAINVSLSPIRPKYVDAVLFIFFSAMISITAQGTSSFFSSDATDSSITAGLALLQASLVIQLFLNIAFISIITIFYHRCFSKGIFQQNWERHSRFLLISLYISATLILYRNIFSTVQIFLPSNSPAWTVEAYFWVFDASPMLAYTMLLHFMHPAKYFPTQSGRSACSASSPTEC